jgi:hypothetical protein
MQPDSGGFGVAYECSISIARLAAWPIFKLSIASCPSLVNFTIQDKSKIGAPLRLLQIEMPFAVHHLDAKIVGKMGGRFPVRNRDRPVVGCTCPVQDRRTFLCER